MNFIVNSIFKSITYILPVGETRDCWLVDCGDVEKVVEQGWYVNGVLLTHTHFDHIYGLNKLIEAFPEALVYTNAEGKEGSRTLAGIVRIILKMWRTLCLRIPRM